MLAVLGGLAPSQDDAASAPGSLQRLAAGETMADVARTYAVDAATINRLAAASPFEHGAVGL